MLSGIPEKHGCSQCLCQHLPESTRPTSIHQFAGVKCCRTLLLRSVFKTIDPLNDLISFCKPSINFNHGLHTLPGLAILELSLIHISEPTRLGMISYAVF